MAECNRETAKRSCTFRSPHAGGRTVEDKKSRLEYSWMLWKDTHGRNVEDERLLYKSTTYYYLQATTPPSLWKLSKGTSCTQCGGRPTLVHILPACTKALVGGKNRWRHDHVLDTIAAGIKRAVREKTIGSRPTITLHRRDSLYK